MSADLNERRTAQPVQPSIDDGADAVFDYWRVLKRRWMLFVGPAILVTAAVGFFALSLPSIYRSEAKILIEDQDISQNILGSTGTSYASQQIQLIAQRLLSIANIQALVDKFDVYKQKESETEIPPSALAARFRQNMELNVVSTDVIDARGRAGQAAIAFTLAFNNQDPVIAQEVTEELAKLFLSENQRSSSSETTRVSEVLDSALKDANAKLIEAEKELADFKATNEGALPEVHQLNISTIDRLEDQLSDVDSRIQALQQRKIQLTAQLVPLSPAAPVRLPSGETILGDQERLRALQAEYRRKSAIYKPDHPDIVSLKQEIETLQATVGNSGGYAQLQQQLQQEKQRLGALQERYSDDYPDVRASKDAIASLEAQLANMAPGESSTNEVADNPAYVLLNSQLQSANLELESLEKRKQDMQAKIDEHEEFVRQAPHVEMQYEALQRKYQNARANYADLQDRLRAADVAANVQQEITGRRFTLLEPAIVPIAPSSPNRLAIMVLGALIAFGVGAGCVILAEILDKSIRSVGQLTRVVGSPPVVVIPYLYDSRELALARSRRHYLVAAAISGSVVLIVYYNFFVHPLFSLSP
jgi:protein tyrosine kinase modulator